MREVAEPEQPRTGRGKAADPPARPLRFPCEEHRSCLPVVPFTSREKQSHNLPGHRSPKSEVSRGAMSLKQPRSSDPVSLACELEGIVPVERLADDGAAEPLGASPVAGRRLVQHSDSFRRQSEQAVAPYQALPIAGPVVSITEHLTPPLDVVEPRRGEGREVRAATRPDLGAMPEYTLAGESLALIDGFREKLKGLSSLEIPVSLAI